MAVPSKGGVAWFAKRDVEGATIELVQLDWNYDKDGRAYGYVRRSAEGALGGCRWCAPGEEFPVFLPEDGWEQFEGVEEGLSDPEVWQKLLEASSGGAPVYWLTPPRRTRDGHRELIREDEGGQLMRWSDSAWSGLSAWKLPGRSTWERILWGELLDTLPRLKEKWQPGPFARIRLNVSDFLDKWVAQNILLILFAGLFAAPGLIMLSRGSYSWTGALVVFAVSTLLAVGGVGLLFGVVAKSWAASEGVRDGDSTIVFSLVCLGLAAALWFGLR